MWFYDPYEHEWQLARRRDRRIRTGAGAGAGGDRRQPAARPPLRRATTSRPPGAGRAGRLALALRILADERLASDVVDALASAGSVAPGDGCRA